MTLSITVGGTTINADEEWAISYLSLRETIADSSVWKALVASPTGKWPDIKTLADADTSPRAAALASINVEREDDEGSALGTPSCLIRQMIPDIAERTAPGHWELSGTFVVELILEVPEDYQSSAALAAIDFANKASRLAREIRKVDLSNGERMEALNVSLLSANGQLNPDEVNGKLCRSCEFLVSHESADL